MVTYDDFLQNCYDLANDDSAKAQAFLTRLGNIGYRRAMRYFRRQFEERTKVATTVAGQQYYQLPVDFSFAKSVKTLVGTYSYPTVEVRGQQEWDDLNRTVNFQNSRPTRHFVRLNAGIGGDELGLWPVPSVSGQPITFVFEAVPSDVVQPAFSSQTGTVQTGSNVLTDPSAKFVPSMQGRYFCAQPPYGDGQYYRVEQYVSSTQLNLQNYYEGPALGGQPYQVCDLFGITEEAQMVPVYYALWHFYLARQNDKLAGEYKGMHDDEMEGAMENESDKSADTLVRRSPGYRYEPDYPAFFPSGGITPQ